MNSVIEALYLRRPKIDYVSPAICEVDFSSSAFPIIDLEALARGNSPTGLVLGGEGGFRLSWDTYPGALCYTVYKAVDELDPFGEYQIVAECISDNFIDLDILGPGHYKVSAITKNGESELSDFILYIVETDCGCPAGEFDTCPTDLLGLIGWYAADCLELADGAEVQTWEDKAEIIGDAPKDLVNGGPVFKNNILGARPALWFTGNQALTIPFCPVLNDFTVIAITVCPSQVTIVGNPSTGDYYLRTTGYPAIVHAAELFQGSSSRATHTAFVFTTTDSMMNTVRREDVFLAQLNRHSEDDSNYGSIPVLMDVGNFSFTKIGGSAGFAYASNDGYIAELCIWDRQLTNLEIQTLFNDYFQPKYSL